MSASPSPHITSSSSSDDEEVQKIEAVTKFSNPVPEERLDCPAFKREDEDDPRVMLERPAGSNEWYQYYYETESYNEIKLRSPATRKTPEHIEWIDKTSSRLSRIKLSTKLWKYIKRTDGAWLPRGTEPTIDPAEKVSKKTSKKGSRKRNHATGTRTASGNVSDQGNAIDDSSGGRAIKKSKKSRLGNNALGNEIGRPKTENAKTNKRSRTKNGEHPENFFSSDMDTDEEHEYDRNKAAMGALANWFLQHNDALTLKLPGTAESAGLEHITQKQSRSKLGGSGKGGGDPNPGNAGRKNNSGVADAGSLKPHPGINTVPSKTLDKKPSIPKVIKNAAPLEDDDLFGRGSLSGKAQWKGLGSSGSSHLPPMNSLPSVGKKDGMKSGGIPSRLGGGGGCSMEELAFSLQELQRF